MTVFSVLVEPVGQVQVYPRLVRIQCNDSYATITAAGFLNQVGSVEGVNFSTTDFYFFNYGDAGQYIGLFQASSSGGVFTLAPAPVINNSIANAIAVYTNTTGSLGESIPAVNTVANTSATPGTVRSITGKMSSTVATQTSGNLVGVRGEVDMVGSSGSTFIYGTQGKVIATGTIASSSWVAGVFGQFDMSAATVTSGQLAAIWGDYGATMTAGTYTGCRGIAMTNTTAAVLNAQIYLYGSATYLLELAASGTPAYYLAAGTSAGSAGDATHCAAQQVIKIEIGGVAAYIPVFTQNT